MTRFQPMISCRGPCRRSLVCAIWLSLMLSQYVRSQVAPLTVTKIDGTQQSGSLVDWSADQLILRTDQRTVELDSSQLLQVRWRRLTEGEESDPTSEAKVSVSRDTSSRNDTAARPGDQAQETPSLFVELVDGTRLPHQAYEVQAGQATIATPLADQPLTISTDRIRFVQLAVGAGQPELTQQEPTGDVLTIRKKSGNAFDYLSGIMGDVSREQVDFNWEGDVIPVKRSKVAALSYYHARRPDDPHPVCWLTLHGGGRLPVSHVSLASGIVEVRTISGFHFSFPVETLADADYSQGKLAYLSDLKPTFEQWTPRIDLPASAELIRQHGLPRRDQSFTGSAITLYWPATRSGAGKPTAGDRRPAKPGAALPGAALSRATDVTFLGGELKSYRKGLAVRSRTELRYRMPAGMQRFTAMAGIDPETASEGYVRLEIFADRRSVWQGEIDGGRTPAEINVLLGDARELRIVVDYGANLDFGDRLHLAEARLSQ